MRTALFALLLAGLPLPAADPVKPEQAATIKEVRLLSRVQPGARVVVAVKVRLAKGYHSHSDKPSEPAYIPTALKPAPPDGARLLAVKYPKGKTKRIPGLPQPLSIYEGDVDFVVSLKLDDDVTLPINIPTTLSYQACKGKICYRPAKLEFDITLPSNP